MTEPGLEGDRRVITLMGDGAAWPLRLALAAGVVLATLILLIVLVPAVALALLVFFVASGLLALRDLGRRAVLRDQRENCRVRLP